MSKMNIKKKNYRAVVVGAGHIGSGFDTPDSKDILTYAHAFSANSRTQLVALVDTNVSHGRRESKRWGVLFYSDIKQMFEEIKPDIVAIASPDDTHARLIKEISQLNPSLIVCEKPPVVTLSEATDLGRQNLEDHLPIIVNFSRRFDSVVCRVREELCNGTYGKIISGSGIYTKGLIHNGLHLIDLARFFFGEITSSSMHFSIKDTKDYGSSIGGVATFERCPQFHIMVGDARFYSIFEFEILTERARIQFVDSGLEMKIRGVIPSKLFEGDYLLGKTQVRKTEILKALPQLVEHTVAVIDGVEKPQSTLSNALESYSTAVKL